MVLKFLNLFMADESGQGTTEYIIILSASVTGAVALARKMLSAVDAGVLRLGGQLDQDLKTGRAPSGIWAN
jgi:hypothetical protein